MNLSSLTSDILIAYGDIGLPGLESLEKLLEIKIEDGRKIGKVPWCCDGRVHWSTQEILALEGITEKESMEQTIARYEAEETTA